MDCAACPCLLIHPTLNMTFVEGQKYARNGMCMDAPVDLDQRTRSLCEWIWDLVEFGSLILAIFYTPVSFQVEVHRTFCDLGIDLALCKLFQGLG